MGLRDTAAQALAPVLIYFGNLINFWLHSGTVGISFNVVSVFNITSTLMYSTDQP